MIHLFPNGSVEVPCTKHGKPSYRWTAGYSEAISASSYSNPLSRKHWYEIAQRDNVQLKFHKDRQEAVCALPPPMILISVVLITDSVIAENHLFGGRDEKEIVKRAEEKFLQLCNQHVPEFKSLDEEGRSNVLDDGYMTFGAAGSVCLNWPEVESSCYNS